MDLHKLSSLGMLDGVWEINTVLEQDRYGSMICNVLDQKLTFSTVVTMAGVDTTVDIMKMFPSLATAVSMVMYRIIAMLCDPCKNPWKNRKFGPVNS